MKKIVLVTGANGGIGKSVVEEFGNMGWFVVGVDKKKLDYDFLKFGQYINTDISKPRNVDELVKIIEKKYKRIDALVNNAAIQIAKPLVKTNLKEWDELMDINLRAVFYLTKKTYKLLKCVKGAVINVSSVHAVATSADISSYAASKGALVALTRAMAIEFAKDGVRVNAILPGAVDTPMLEEGLGRGHVRGKSMKERKKDLGSKHVLGRVGKPEEIAKSIAFLADNTKSSFMTGHPLVVDGGATIRLSTE